MRELEHRYGDRVHLIDDVMAQTGLTRLCNAATDQASVMSITHSLYQDVLLRCVVNRLFPRTLFQVPTPMAHHVAERGFLSAEGIDPRTKVVVATLLRAGEIPSQACCARLIAMLEEGALRKDFFGAGRTTDDEHRVTGTAVTYRKAGSIAGRFLLIPDPMGATGGTVVKTLELYGGTDQATGIAALHLIITPEHIHRVLAAFPSVHIFALRLDRGMSDKDVLETVPGTYPDREFGLTETHYIAPGAGDMGLRLTGAE